MATSLFKNTAYNWVDSSARQPNSYRIFSTRPFLISLLLIFIIVANTVSFTYGFSYTSWNSCAYEYYDNFMGMLISQAIIQTHGAIFFKFEPVWFNSNLWDAKFVDCLPHYMEIIKSQCPF